jgi:hypothetical protein
MPAGDGPCRTAAERVRHSRMTPVPQPSVTLVTETPTLMGIDPFVPGSMLLTYPRSETRDANAESPRSNRVLVVPMVGSGCLAEYSSPKGVGTRGHSITSVITTATRARRRRPYPRTTLDVPLAWPPRIVFCCGRLRPITRKRPTVAGGAPLLWFPIPFARGAQCASSVDFR